MLQAPWHSLGLVILPSGAPVVSLGVGVEGRYAQLDLREEKIQI